MHALRFGRIVALPSARNAAVPYVLTDVISGGGALKWNLGQIAANDSDRASILEAAPSSVELAKTITDVFTSALNEGDVRVAMEEARSNAKDLRAVLQFHVGSKLFDWFFNSRTGYRAAFRSGSRSARRYFALAQHVRHPVMEPTRYRIPVCLYAHAMPVIVSSRPTMFSWNATLHAAYRY